MKRIRDQERIRGQEIGGNRVDSGFVLCDFAGHVMSGAGDRYGEAGQMQHPEALPISVVAGLQNVLVIVEYGI